MIVAPSAPPAYMNTIHTTHNVEDSSVALNEIYVTAKTRTLHEIHCLDVVAYPCVQHAFNMSVFHIPSMPQAEELVEVLRNRFQIHATVTSNTLRTSHQITWRTDTVNATLPMVLSRNYADLLDRMGVRIICKGESEYRCRLRLPHVGAQLPAFVENISDYDPMEYIPTDSRVLKVMPRNGAYLALIKPLLHANCEILERGEYYVKIRVPLDNLPDTLHNNALIEGIEFELDGAE